ncbi:MAG: cation-translocating P-type ATPase [Nitrososphaerota archaeon]|nr:cation-translocating P-type ATPase [Candidatus Bathyarchaeota archaeon]MDW8022460.1 cation-translocating P-type ATPase [Nitrososphaerota archaeon]
MEKPWHAMRTEEVLDALKVGREGLPGQEASERLRKYGYNELVEKKRVTPFQIFLNQFKDIFVIMLLIAVVLSVAIGWYKSLSAAEGGALDEYVDAITIGAIVALNAIVGFVQEYRSEKAIEAMKKLAAPRARVLRDGKEVVIPAKEVVPGDIILLEAGDRIPADARLIEAIELKTEEAALTGESTPVNKDVETVEEKTPISDRSNMVFMGTHVTYGRGKAVVVATGMNTEFGKIAEMVQTVEEEETPLQQKLGRFAKKLGIIIVVACVIIFILEVMREGHHLENIVDVFMTAVALAVSAVPEGLPAVVTVCLALGARELAKRNAILRRLASAETLGAVTVICSDKTGTLTKGEMTVRQIYTSNKKFDVTGVGYEAKGEFLLDGKPVDVKADNDLLLLLEASTLCTNARYDGANIVGDTTEGALIVAAAKAGVIKEELEKTFPRIHEVPFTSERKRMTTVHRSPDGKVFAYTKGAPEVILERCTHIIINGEVMKLSERKRKEILKVNEEMAGKALRVLGVAFKEVSPSEAEKFDEETLENDLVFIGLAGMIDPPREEAKIAVKKCEEAGIKTVMITGDHKLTAVAVAKELGILKSDEASMTLTGAELDALGDEEFEKIVEKVSVYARVSPEHKLRIVKFLKKKGHIVAMTGDGVNDAPALKQSDIGVAMGITGTDVTREAADIVLADDNFATIVNAVEGGRTIYNNIRKFSFFLMRCNFDELALIGTFALLGLELPLTAPMILWLNLVTDGGPALALTMDPPEKDVMKRPPRNPKEGILHGRFASIITTFILQFALTGGLFYWQYYLLPGPLTAEKLAQARTMAFVRATFQELFVVWNCRSEQRSVWRMGKENFKNKYLLFSVVISALATVLVAYFGFMGTVWLDDPMEWAIAITASLSGLFILPEVFYGRKIWRWT